MTSEEFDNSWYDVKGFEGLYKVNKQGDIYTCHYNRLLKFKVDKDGYLSCTLTKDKKPHYLRVHRIVALTFLDNPENKPMVNHINGIKDDNRLSNLEWVNASENAIHAYSNGLSEKSRKVASEYHGHKHYAVHKVTGEVYNFNSMKQLSLFLGKKDDFVKLKLRYNSLEKISKDLDYNIFKGEHKID